MAASSTIFEKVYCKPDNNPTSKYGDMDIDEILSSLYAT